MLDRFDETDQMDDESAIWHPIPEWTRRRAKRGLEGRLLSELLPCGEPQLQPLGRRATQLDLFRISHKRNQGLISR